MIAWIQQCPNCGYCAADASQFEHGLRKALESSDYQQHLTDTALPRLAPRFICSALLLEAAGKMHEAGREFLRVAWVMDDAELVVGSKTWRDRAAKCLTGAMESSEAERRAEIGAVLVDCLRRAGRGQEALPVIDRILSGESSAVIEQVLVFQRELITHGDIRVHKISEAIKKEN